MDLGIAPLLDKSRQALLDLSTRNRLLSLPRGNKNARIIDIVDELSAEAFRLLVQDGKGMSFLAAKDKGWILHQTSKDEPENEDSTKKKYKPTL